MKEHLKSYIDNSSTPQVRGLRILLEYFYATEIFEPIVRDEIKIISVFGSARTKEGTTEYKDAYELGKSLYREGYAVVTGASCGIMQAANQGVADQIAESLVRIKKAKTLEEARRLPAYRKFLNKYSVGLKISLPFEPRNNPYVGVFATFHYFMVRKFFFGTLSKGFIACEGGWGTRDELFEILTLVQTGKTPLMPVVYVSTDHGHLVQDLEHAVRKGYIHKEDLRLLKVVKRPQDAVKEIMQFYKRVDQITHLRNEVIRIDLKDPLTPDLQQRILKASKQWADFIGPVHFSSKFIELRKFPHISYGYLRRFVEVINR